MPQEQQLAREYELVYILRPSVSPSEARRVADRITDVVEKRGAKLTRVDNWGKRKLAYPIKKHTRGVFIFVKLVGFTDVVSELERNLRNLDEVMRYQTVRLEDVHDLTTLEVDPEEVQFRDIEAAAEEEEEPTFEERLGMSARARREVEEADEDTESDAEEESDVEGEAAATAEEPTEEEE